jgi:hypothetical protein
VLDVHVHTAMSLVEALDEQPELLAGQSGSVVLRVRLKLGQRLAAGGLPERQLPVQAGGRHVNDDLGQPAVVRHPANLQDPAPRPLSGRESSLPAASGTHQERQMRTY